jgi:hypothetical protein
VEEPLVQALTSVFLRFLLHGRSGGRTCLPYGAWLGAKVSMFSSTAFMFAFSF